MYIRNKTSILQNDNKFYNTVERFGGIRTKKSIWCNDKKLSELIEILYEIALKFVGKLISELRFNDNSNIKKKFFYEAYSVYL